MNLDDSQIIADFVIESREHLADIESQLLAVEASGTDVAPELINEIFRAVHSVKGASGFLGFQNLGQLAHDMENVLNRMRNRELFATAAITDVLLRAADALKSMVENIESSNSFDVSAHRTALQAIVADSSIAAVEPAEAPEPVEPIAASEPEPAPEVQVALETDEMAEPVAESPVAPAAPQAPAAPVERQEPAAAPARTEHASEPKPAEPAPARLAAANAATGAAAPADTNIRVSVSVLDALMNLAGELVLARNRLMQTVNAGDHHLLDSVAASVDHVTSELQETIMLTRMQVVGTVFQRFPRLVRDLSLTLGKQCQLIVEGDDVELDKSIIEAIGDPLTHLIRNAVDHGIEMPEVRQEAGKPAGGKILLQAFHQAGKVNITVRDDGRGINVERLKEKAVSHGVISSEQARAMGEREAVRLIFHPGLSTAEKVTDVSGRGVGMDVVRTNIEKLGGTVGVESQLGAGTAIQIKLPLTLAIVPSLVVECAGRPFAIPQASISELVRVKASEISDRIDRIKRASVLRLRGNLLPLVSLRAALGLPECDDSRKANDAHESAMNIIVVEAGHLRYGLVVDSLHDSEEIVVKPLGRHMKDCPCLAGATILGDGDVALILDVTGIAGHMSLAVTENERCDDSAATTTTGEERQTVLLFTNDPQEQFAIPMAVVARIERVRTDQIDTVGGQQVLQYRGGSLPIFAMEDHVRAKPRPESSRVYIIVFRVSNREIGLIAPELVDIAEVGTNIDSHTFREPGVMGSMVIDGRTTRLLDLFNLIEVARPDWIDTESPAKSASGSAPRVLLAEDSDFFRRQLTIVFEAAGFEVTACEDGMVAWNAFQESEEPFDLLVTDVEMPNLDGLGLARRVRQHPAGTLPIIAVTSLAGEDDIQRGMEAGVDDYHVKLDRERLMNSAARLVRRGVQAAAHPVC